MDRININTEKLDSVASQLNRICASLDSVSNSISSALSEVKRVAPGQNSVISKINRMKTKNGEASARVRKLSGKVSAAANRWEKAEKKINSMETGESESPFSTGNTGALGDLDSVSIPQLLLEFLKHRFGFPGSVSDWNDDHFSMAEVISRGMTFLQDPAGTVFALFGGSVVHLLHGDYQEMSAKDSGVLGGTITGSGWIDGTYREVKWETLTRDKIGYQNKKAEKILKQKKIPLAATDNKYDVKREATLFEYTLAGWEASDALLHGDASGEYGIASGSASYDVAKYEAEASLKAGLYSTKVGPDGKEVRVLEPGISAKVGAGFTAFEAEASGKIGTDDFNLHGKVDGKALTASAEAKLEVGIIDGKPVGHVKMGAEANLAEVSGEVGLNVIGVDAKVTGSLKVGVGADLDVGYKDGKFSCEIGASLGVGFDVGFEVDVGGLVDGVTETCGKVADSISALGGAIVDGASDFISWLF